MDDSTQSVVGSSMAGGRSLRHRPPRPSPLSNGRGTSLEGAASDVRPTIQEDRPRDVDAGSKRGRTDEVAIGDQPAATAITDRHLADDPYEGAVAPLQPCESLIPSRGCKSKVALR